MLSTGSLMEADGADDADGAESAPAPLPEEPAADARSAGAAAEPASMNDDCSPGAALGLAAKGGPDEYAAPAGLGRAEVRDDGAAAAGVGEQGARPVENGSASGAAGVALGAGCGGGPVCEQAPTAAAAATAAAFAATAAAVARLPPLSAPPAPAVTVLGAGHATAAAEDGCGPAVSFDSTPGHREEGGPTMGQAAALQCGGQAPSHKQVVDAGEGAGDPAAPTPVCLEGADGAATQPGRPAVAGLQGSTAGLGLEGAPG